MAAVPPRRRGFLFAKDRVPEPGLWRTVRARLLLRVFERAPSTRPLISLGYAQPLDGEKFFWDVGAGIAGIINDDWHGKHDVVREIERSFDGETPLAAKITFATAFCGGRNNRHEIRAGADLVPNL